MRIGCLKTDDDIEIGNSSAIGLADELGRKSVPSSLIGVWIRSSSFYRYPRPSSAARSPPPARPRSANRIRVSAVRLEHVPTFLFFMCTTPRAMGIPSYYLYRRCDFSLSLALPLLPLHHRRYRFPCPFPPPMGIYGYRISIEVHETSPQPPTRSLPAHTYACAHTYTNIRILSISLSLHSSQRFLPEYSRCSKARAEALESHQKPGEIRR